MAYRSYFSSLELPEVLWQSDDAVIKYTVALDFESEADALAKCRNFLKMGEMFPVALDRPDGTRLLGREIIDLCFPRPQAETPVPRRSGDK